VPLKVVPKAGCECTLEKVTNESKGKHEQKFNAEQLLEFLSDFKEASKNFILIFSRTKQAKNLKTICACQESMY
jgi:hypothetical protein